jgi:hypothetical protein
MKLLLLLLLLLNCITQIIIDRNYYCYYYYYYFVFVCLLQCINVFPPELACNLTLILCCDCPYCNYFCLHCAVSVIGLVAVDSAHK